MYYVQGYFYNYLKENHGLSDQDFEHTFLIVRYYWFFKKVFLIIPRHVIRQKYDDIS